MRRLLLGGLLVVAGCAAAPVRLSGVTGPVAWHMTDVQLANNPVLGPPGGHAAFTLLLPERTGVGITFTEVAQVVSGVHLAPTAAAQAGAWRLAPRGELRLPVWVWWVCPEAGEACVAGPPHWHLVLTGTDDHGHAVQLAIELDAPAAATVVAEAPAERRVPVPTR